MIPQIKQFQTKYFIGRRIQTTLLANATAGLWRSFMPLRKQLAQVIGNHLYSIEIYNPALNFNYFNQSTPFEKWAAVEVPESAMAPPELEKLQISEGLYAVFVYKGAASDFMQVFTYIFNTWFPESDYEVDNTRPHFEVMGDKYNNTSADSEEEIWVPVKHKSAVNS